MSNKYLIEPDGGQVRRVGVLLVNLGTPAQPTTAAVRAYLREFLSDPRVVEIPRLVWTFILHGFVLRRRPQASAKKYAAIWTDQGSPLLVYSHQQAAGLQQQLRDRALDAVVMVAMRYGMPSIDAALQSLREQGVDRLLVLPLYPQYAASTTGSTFDAIARNFCRRRYVPELRFIQGYHDHPAYIQALAHRVKQSWLAHGRGEKLLMSFHGLPLYTRDRGDPYYDCCQKTGRLLAEALQLESTDYCVTFQSRFGRTAWLQPYTDKTIEQLAHSGTRYLDVICPGFASDCLETLEEIQCEVRAVFLRAGGHQFRYIPCLNAEGSWLTALADIVQTNVQGWSLSAPHSL